MPTLSPEQPTIPESGAESVTACPNCEKPDYAGNGWCRFCGYYGVLGKCVELESWEQDFVNGEYVGEEEVPAGHPWIAAIKSVPIWIWCLCGVLGVIALVTVLVRLHTVPGSEQRLVAATGLLGLGLVVFVGTHVYAGIRNLQEDPDFNLSDIVVHPIQLWCTVLIQLPDSYRRVAFGWGGLWILILVHVVVGVPYLQLAPFKSVSKQQSDKASLADVAAVAARAGAARAAGEREKPDSGYVTKTYDALIAGFTTTPDRTSIGSLVLAVQSNGAWRVAGTVSGGFTAETLEKLKSQLASIRRQDPFVPTGLSANWVKPVLRVRIEAEYSEAADRFRRLKFLKLL